VKVGMQNRTGLQGILQGATQAGWLVSLSYRGLLLAVDFNMVQRRAAP
jgi:hypothetical protein